MVINRMLSFEDCPICLDTMHPTDYDHPLQCSRRCGYNFCQNCIESLISSSKDDYMEASDGNLHVKVFLLCPNCRSDLSSSIRDTLLLRKADDLEAASEDQLSATQLRLKEVVRQKDVQAAIRTARRLEAEYLGRELPSEADEGEEGKEEIAEQAEYEEEGIEIDLVNGVHASVHTPKQPAARKVAIQMIVDPTLFAGLDYFLSDDEKDYVTQLMTSGQTSTLVTAAQILYFCVQKNLNPQQQPHQQLTSSGSRRPSSPRRSTTLTRRCSVFDLIDELQEAHRKKDKKAKQTMEWTNRLYQQNINASRNRAAQQRKMNLELQKSVMFQKLFPIPVRMPKCFEIDLREVFDLQFVDYEWDGTIKDAYSKITIGFTGRIERTTNYNEGVATILGGLEEDVRIALPGRPRVLLSYVGQAAGKQGAMKGDVVTHIDGKDVSDASAAQMWIRINAAKQRGQTSLIMTLNAEQSVAEALKRRAIAIAEASR